MIPCLKKTDTHESAFHCLSKDELKRLNENRVEVKYKKGEIITKEGSFVSEIIYVQEGLAKLYFEGKPNDLIIKIVKPNHFIGLSTVFDDNNSHLFTSTALTDVSVCHYDVEFFKHLLKTNARFSYKIINFLNKNTGHIYSKLFCMTQRNSHGRVANTMRYFVEEIFNSKKFVLPFSRAEYADFAGLSMESVVRILKEFKDDGILKVHGKSIEVLNFDSLLSVCDNG